MSSPRITFTYTGAGVADVADTWWIRIEQEGVTDDTATVSAAASLLDAAFAINPCDTEASADPVDAPGQEDFESAVAGVVQVAACDYDADGNVKVYLYIVRSHLTEPYKLQLQGGEQGAVEQVDGPVTVSQRVEGAASLVLPWPVVSGFCAAWRGAVYSEAGSIHQPKIRRSGNTLNFGQAVTGTIVANYQTEYDRIDVTVLGTEEGEPGACTARAFFHGLVAEHECKLPDASEVDTDRYCEEKWRAPSDDQVICYKINRLHQVCSCSEHEVDVIETEVEVDCPENMRCSGNATECRHLVGTESATEYVQCAGDKTGTFDGNLSDQEFYFSRCCEWPRRDLPQCKVRKSVWLGGAPIDPGAEHYRGLYGPTSRFVPVSPPAGICGEWTIEQRIMGTDCCDGVEPLAWDWDEAAEVVAANGTATVGVTGGGRFPYTWIIMGEGFWLGSGKKRLVTSGPTVTVYGVNACGSANIYVSDGCSQTRGEIRSTAGRWQHRWSGYPHCVEDPSADGFFQCSAYIDGFVSGHSGRLRGRWWYGPYDTSPPAEAPIMASRISHICGLWAKAGCAGDWFVRAPVDDDLFYLPALVVYGMANCVAVGGGTVNACLYHFVEQLAVYEWVC
jgi:hypothetical protein